MRALLLCVGRLKEAYLQDACGEYLKRLGRYANLELVELKDEPEPAAPSPALQRRVLEAEGARILQRIHPEDYVVALAIQGQSYDSLGLARHLAQLEQRGRLVFVIGGSLGLSQDVYARCNERLSFSPLTFPHQLMRVLFLEQLYRCCRINAGEPYHK